MERHGNSEYQQRQIVAASVETLQNIRIKSVYPVNETLDHLYLPAGINCRKTGCVSNINGFYTIIIAPDAKLHSPQSGKIHIPEQPQ